MATYWLKHYGFVGDDPYLAHYGVKGMKWGRRNRSRSYNNPPRRTDYTKEYNEASRRQMMDDMFNYLGDRRDTVGGNSTVVSNRDYRRRVNRAEALNREFGRYGIEARVDEGSPNNNGGRYDVGYEVRRSNRRSAQLLGRTAGDRDRANYYSSQSRRKFKKR